MTDKIIKEANIKSTPDYDHHQEIMNEYNLTQDDMSLYESMRKNMSLAKALIDDYMGVGFYVSGHPEVVFDLAKAVAINEQTISINHLINSVKECLGEIKNAQ